MKKVIIPSIAVCIIACVVVLACNVVKSGVQSNEIYYQNADGMCEMINPDEVLQLSDVVDIQPCFTHEMTINSLTEESDAIIIGNIKEILYSSDEGMPWTQLKISLDECIYGNIDTDTVILFDMGGYIDVDTLRNNYLYDEIDSKYKYAYIDCFQNDKYQIGDSGIFFVKKESRFNISGYDIFGASYGAVMYDNNKKMYEKQNEDGSTEWVDKTDILKWID